VKIEANINRKFIRSYGFEFSAARERKVQNRRFFDSKNQVTIKLKDLKGSFKVFPVFKLITYTVLLKANVA